MFVKNIPQPQSSFTWFHLKRGKSGRVFIYFRNYVPLKILKIDNSQERMTCEFQIGSKIRKFVSIYWSVSRAKGRFEKFRDMIELTLDLNAVPWDLKKENKLENRKQKNRKKKEGKSLVLYWSHFRITTKVGSGFKCSSIFTSKLSSSN